MPRLSGWVSTQEAFYGKEMVKEDNWYRYNNILKKQGWAPLSPSPDPHPANASHAPSSFLPGGPDPIQKEQADLPPPEFTGRQRQDVSGAGQWVRGLSWQWELGPTGAKYAHAFLAPLSLCPHDANVCERKPRGGERSSVPQYPPLCQKSKWPSAGEGEGAKGETSATQRDPLS